MTECERHGLLAGLMQFKLMYGALSSVFQVRSCCCMICLLIAEPAGTFDVLNLVMTSRMSRSVCCVQVRRGGVVWRKVRCSVSSSFQHLAWAWADVVHQPRRVVHLESDPVKILKHMDCCRCRSSRPWVTSLQAWRRPSGEYVYPCSFAALDTTNSMCDTTGLSLVILASC